MMTQGVLSFQYQKDKNLSGLTAFGGVGPYLDLAYKLGLHQLIDKHIHLRSGEQGWTDKQIIMSLVFLNLLGGDFVADIDHLEQDQGFSKLWDVIDNYSKSRQQKRREKKRWHKPKERTFPSPSAIFSYLKSLVSVPKIDENAPLEITVSQLSTATKCFLRVVKDLVANAQKLSPKKIATLDQDATLVKTYKNSAKFCYKHFLAYQPLNTYWFEHDLIVHTEFRHGNVPAGFEELRVFKEALEQLPAGVEKVYLRTDTAGYQHDLMDYCARGKNDRFGKIEFAISADVTPAFKKAVSEIDPNAWNTLYKYDQYGNKIDTSDEWAEVCFVPKQMAKSKKQPHYRYLAIRETFHEHENQKSDEELPFQTIKDETNDKKYKLFGLVTNRQIPGNELILWHRERCGKSEEVHSVQKGDLAGGHLPSQHIEINAAWWLIMIIAFNLNSVMKNIVLGGDYKNWRMKAIRFGMINIAARVVKHSRKLFIQIGGRIDFFLEIRKRILTLGGAPPD